MEYDLIINEFTKLAIYPNIKELIDICDMTGYTLAVIDEKEDIIISFSSSDFDDD